MGWKNDPENILNLKFKPHDQFLISKVPFAPIVLCERIVTNMKRLKNIFDILIKMRDADSESGV